jgi:hypothetical protein
LWPFFPDELKYNVKRQNAVLSRSNLFLTSVMLTHARLDALLVASLVVAVAMYEEDPIAYILNIPRALFGNFPAHYEPVFDFIKNPMDPLLAVSIYLVGMYFLIKTYHLERGVVGRAHKKFKAHGNKTPVAIHAIGSVIEMAVGLAAVLRPDNQMLAYGAALLALFVNVPSGAILTPRVYGIKYLTVTGFALFGVIRSMEAYRVFFMDHRLVPNLWILLQVGTVVRLLGWFVLPYSTTNGIRGDLFTEPSIYSFNILLSGYMVVAFVYPPRWLMGSLLLYVIAKQFYPPRLSIHRRPCED